MKIQSVQNNTNFQGLHVDKKYYAPTRINYYGYHKKYPITSEKIQKCAEKFEVLIERGKKLPSKHYDSIKNELQNFTCSILGWFSSMGGTVLACNLTDVLKPSIPVFLTTGILGSGLGYLASRLFSKNKDNDEYEFNLQIGKRIKENPITHKKELVNTLSKKYPLNSWEDIERMPELLELAKQRDEQNFMDEMEKFDVENIYEPEKILSIINDNQIKSNYSTEEIFNYKLNDENSDTLLTKFFDIVPTEDNQKDYDKIIEKLKGTENIDYNQVDTNGISIIEKIINSENSKALELVRDFEFNYAKGMDLAYDNLENASFKRKVKRLNVNFPSIEEAAKINSNEALSAVLPEFASPFCDISKVMENIFGKIDLSSYYSTLAFLEKNGVDTSSVKIKKTWED